MPIKLSKRLRTLALMLPERYPRLLDVGCDHAQLSIQQLQSKRCRQVLAIEIEEGPFDRAKRAIDCAHFQDRAYCVLNDGLRRLELLPGDVLVIAGMGGLEICDILEQSEFTSYLSKGFLGADLRLVLQPMKSQALLRIFLAYQGFSLLDESVVREKKKVYTIAGYSFPEGPLKSGLKDLLLETKDDEMLFAIHKNARISPLEALLGYKIAEAHTNRRLDSLSEDELYYYKTELEKISKLRDTDALINGLGHVSRLFEENFF